jgi:hypothetical protein
VDAAAERAGPRRRRSHYSLLITYSRFEDFENFESSNLNCLQMKEEVGQWTRLRNVLVHGDGALITVS